MITEEGWLEKWWNWRGSGTVAIWWEKIVGLEITVQSLIRFRQQRWACGRYPSLTLIFGEYHERIDPITT